MNEPKQGSERCFHADLTDEKKKIRLVGFKEEQQKQLESYKLWKSPVKLTDCVQKSTFSGNFEIKIKTKMQLSPEKSFQIPDSSSTDETQWRI